MKKLLFSVAILAVAASCSKNEVTEVAPAAQSVIGFATLNNLTRDANDDKEMYQVYAAQEGVTAAWYIDDVSVSNTALTNTYYWPADNSYLDFYAYAPAGSDNIDDSGVVAATTISIEYTVPTTADEDFTIAAPLKGETENTVAFTFAHQLAKADIEVVLDEELEKAGYALTMEDDAEVTLSVANETATYDVMGVTATSYATGSGASYTTDYAENYFIFMPQAATGCTISVSGVTITDKSGKNIIENETLGLYTIKSTDLAAGFLQNYYYQITLTIDENSVIDGPDPIFGDAITFSATTATWTTPNAVGLGTDNQPEVTEPDAGE